MSSAGSVWYVGGLKIWCKILLLLNMADMDCLLYVERCGVSSAEYHIHLVGVNRLSACREFLVCIVAQNVGMVWMCCQCRN